MDAVRSRLRDDMCDGFDRSLQQFLPVRELIWELVWEQMWEQVRDQKKESSERKWTEGCELQNLCGGGWGGGVRYDDRLVP